MHVAVTGATGFVGHYLLQVLADAGHTCRAWARPHHDLGQLSQEGVEWIHGTLNDASASDELVRGCDAVVHAALDRPGTGFRGSEGDLLEFASKNILGTLRLIEAAKRASVDRFVFISTCAVHERILDDRPLDEAHPTWAMTHYGAHKAAIENFIHSYGWGDGYAICALRPTGIYGKAIPVEHSKWYSLIQRVVSGQSVTCQRGGKEVHARDVARAAELLLRSDGITGESFNCYDRYVSEFEVAQLTREISGSDAIIEGESKSPKHQIVTDKIRNLGMTFGGDELLRATITEIVDAIRNR